MTSLQQIKSTIQILSHIDKNPSLLLDLGTITLRKKIGSLNSIPYPLNINLEVTYVCNAFCHFCINAPGKANKNINRENYFMPSSIVDKLLDELPEKKCHFFIIGGEPFLHKDIFNNIAAIKAKGHSCGLVTNAVLLNAEKIRQLIDLKLDYIIFSIHGNEEEHDKITKIKGSYRNLLHSIAAFNKLDPKMNCKVHVNSVMTKLNLHTFQELIEDLRAFQLLSLRIAHPSFNLKHEIESFNQMNKALLGEEPRINNYYLPKPEFEPEEILAFMERIKEQKTDFRILFKPNLNEDDVRNWYSNDNKMNRECFFLYSACFVNPDGDVYPCQTIKYKLGNVHRSTIQQIWNGARYRELRKQISQKIPVLCRRCCKL